MSGRPRILKLGRDYGPWKGITFEQASLAKQRTMHLRTSEVLNTLTIDNLLANAWLQGVADAADSLGPETAEIVASGQSSATMKEAPEGLG